MKSKKMVILASAIVVSIGVSLTTIVVSSASNGKQNAVTRGANKVSMMTNLEDVHAEGERMFGVYSRKEAELKGEITSDSPRITLDQINEIINESPDYQTVASKLNGIYPYPDYIGGSGVSITEYWINSSGDDKIELIAEQEEVIHITDSFDESKDVYDVLLKKGG